ncbi:MAG TPA: hypothetical protein VF466_02725 [Candidatus Saccharimonadales bacterium]
MSDVEAARAQFEYMAQGAEVGLGNIAVEQLDAWVRATEGMQPLAHHNLTAGWLRVETAMTIVSRRRIGLDAPTDLEPEALLDGAQDRFDLIALRQSNDVVLRSRALVAAGSVGLYRALVRTGTAVETDRVPLSLRKPYEKQIEAAELLLRAAARRRNNPPLHDLHVQAFLALFNGEVEDTQLVAFPVPTRMQDEGDERSVDIMLWDIDTARQNTGLFMARVTADESAVVAGHITLPTGLLKNSAYPSEIGQGTLQMLVEDHRGRPQRLAPQRKRHRDVVLRAVVEQYIDQRVEGQALSFETDPITGLDEARRWYGGLSPLRRLTAADAQALEQCLNPFENAYWSGGLSLDDTATLAWLRLEMGTVNRSSQEPARAEDLFEAVMQRTEAQQDWTRYCQALAGKVTARLHDGLYSGRDRGEVVATYREDLTSVIDRLYTGLQQPEMQGSQHEPHIRRLLDRLLACYAISSDEEELHIAILAAPRQQAQPDTATGCDVLVVPLVGDDYNLATTGRVRLSATTRPESLDRGVATIDPVILRGTWHLLDEAPAANAAAVETARQRLLNAVEPVLFV